MLNVVKKVLSFWWNHFKKLLYTLITRLNFFFLESGTMFIILSLSKMLKQFRKSWVDETNMHEDTCACRYWAEHRGMPPTVKSVYKKMDNIYGFFILYDSKKFQYICIDKTSQQIYIYRNYYHHHHYYYLLLLLMMITIYRNYWQKNNEIQKLKNRLNKQTRKRKKANCNLIPLLSQHRSLAWNRHSTGTQTKINRPC